jgi:hypothetical protein
LLTARVLSKRGPAILLRVPLQPFVEWIALLIGPVMSVTPSETGIGFSLADWFYDAPTYVQQVWVDGLQGVLLYVAEGSVACGYRVVYVEQLIGENRTSIVGERAEFEVCTSVFSGYWRRSH